MSESRIGNLNGKWSVLFRAALALQPLVLAWGTWVTVQLFELREARATMVTAAQFASFKDDVIKNAISDELKREILLSREKLDKIAERLTRVEVLILEKKQ